MPEPDLPPQKRSITEPDLPPQKHSIVEPDLPPQSRKVLLYAAGGGFLGALLAILIMKFLAGCCCAPGEARDGPRQSASLASLTELSHPVDSPA